MPNFPQWGVGHGPPTQSIPTAMPDHVGSWYTSVLAELHECFKPKSYFEIGTLSGSTLALANCESIAVDPAYKICSNVFGQKLACHLYQMTSDDFFAQHEPSKIFNRPIDFAFLDGLHLYDFLLRDFMNTEKHCNSSSIIAMHDCIPTDVFIGRRDFSDFTHAAASPHTDWWAGDVWKTLLILQEYRPDLKIYRLDAPPTGLVLITNLDPQSSILEKNYPHAIKAMEDISLADYGISNFYARIQLQSTESIWEISNGSKRLISDFQ